MIDYGASVVSIRVPDRRGNFADIALGYSSLDKYEADNEIYFGGTIGRCANMISKGRFTLDGTEYLLAANFPPDHLHGGIRGFNKVVWSGEAIRTSKSVGVKFVYLGLAE